MIKVGAGALAAAAALTPSAAHAGTTTVDMFGTAFRPSAVTVVAGDSVQWRNGDLVPHDVKAANVASGIVARFDSFTQRFDAPGAQPYLCTLHPQMTGRVDVLAATLSAPTGAAFAGEEIALKGRTAPGTASVAIERDAGDGSWRASATATPAANGSFRATVEAASGYRARTAAGESPAVGATVLPAPKVRLTAAKGRLKVTSTPAAKGLVARVQQRRPGGWRTFARARLDAAGRASVKAREGTLRVVLARASTTTALATSKTVRL